MEYIPDHDKYLDPPDYPTHENCYRCGERCDYDDMTKQGDAWYCDACFAEKIEEYDNDN